MSEHRGASSAERRPNALAYFGGVVLQATALGGAIWIGNHLLPLGASPNATESDAIPLVMLVLAAAACLIVAPALAGAALMNFGLSGRWPARGRLLRAATLITIAAVVVGVFNVAVS